MRKTVLCVILALLAAGTGVFAGGGKQGGSSEGKKMVIGMSAVNLTDMGLIQIRLGAEYAAQDYNCELIWKACDGNPDVQIDIIRGFIQQKVDAIWIDSVDVAVIAPIIKEITDAGIIPMTAGSKVAGVGNYNPIYPDYDDTYFAGRAVGEYYKDKKGTVGLIVAMPGSMISEKRQQGFTDALVNYPNLKLVVDMGRWDANVTMQAAENIIRANPDLLHLHIIADGMSYGAYRAVQNTGAKITISSSDGETDALKYMEQGAYILDNAVGNARLGYWGIALLRRIHDGEKMAFDQYLPTYKIMGDNVRKIVENAGFKTLNGVNYSFVTINEARNLLAPESFRKEFGPGPGFVPQK
jgi:ribose transport system substrate-binding protein